ncbi:MAG: carboxymuconolactone decarboxylase family protein [Beijerinckiaceae bacterium]
MDQKVTPSPRLHPLPADHNPALKPNFEASIKNLGFIPNSMLIMQRRPEIMKAFAAMSASIWDKSSTVDNGFKRLIAHVSSRAAGCQYCMAHTAGGALHLGVDEAKVAAIWDYQTSPLFSEAERVALDLAAAAGAVPNDVSEDMFLEMRKHWSEEQIVEIVATISVFGFLNRWNDTMGTPLEDEPLHVGEKLLAGHGWEAGKHAR